MGGNHVHHQVFGILIIIGTGIFPISATPHGAPLSAAAAVFGLGIGLTVDEFALWLHLEDVYWADQGRKSVDAIFCVLVITGALIGGTNFVTGRVGTAAWWSSVGVITVNLLLCVICLLKGKVVTGVIGLFIGVVALVGAIRLAKPESWWANHRYAAAPARRPRGGAATTIATPSAGTGCGISSPAPPPGRGRADGVLAPPGNRGRCQPRAVKSPPVSTSGTPAAGSADEQAVTAERCAAQLLCGDPAGSAEEVAGRLLAIQAQDPRGARLAVRARSAGLSASDVDAALAAAR